MRLLHIAAAALLSTACVTHGRAVIDQTSNIEGVGGTIAGSVRASDGTSALSGRKVTATNEQTGATFAVSTASNGGYTVKVPAGKYRLDVELRAGESLASRPDPTDVNVGDLDPDRDFVLTARR
jgi:hypothetical protein